MGCPSIAAARHLQACLFGALLFGSSSAKGQMCDAPNSYQFTNPRYFASAGTTDVTAFVRFTACMGRSGYVNYQTADGTAVAYQDYTPKSGTLFFTNWYSPPLPVSIQLKAQQPGAMPKTIRLILTTNQYDQSAVGIPTEASLLINVAPPPNLAISAATNGTVTISWPADGTDILLEKAATSSGPNWTAIASSAGYEGVRVVVDEISGNAGFYRLRRSN